MIEQSLRAELEVMGQHLVYCSIPEFLLKWGRQYPKNENTYAGKRGQPKLCYYNSALLAIADPSLTYVEGRVEVMDLPIPHAWCVDKKGFVVDVTFQNDIPDHVGEYWGVPFDTEYIWKRATSSGYWESVIEMNREILVRSTERPEGVLEWR